MKTQKIQDARNREDNLIELSLVPESTVFDLDLNKNTNHS